MFIRESNEGLIKKLLWNTPDGVSRRDIAESYGMELQTVTAYLNKLLRQGMICARKSNAQGRGRPGTCYYVVDDTKLSFYGLYISNGKIYFSVRHGKKFHMVKSVSIVLEQESLSSIAAILNSMFDEFIAQGGSSMNAIGIILPNNVSSRFLAIKQLLEQQLEVPVFVETAINAYNYQLKVHYPRYQNIGCLHFGFAFEFSVFRHDNSLEKFSRLKEEMQKISFAIDAEEGSTGTFYSDSYITASTLLRRFREIKKDYTLQYADLISLSEKSDRETVELLKISEEQILAAIKEVAANFKLDLLVVLKRPNDRHLNCMTKLRDGHFQLDGCEYKFYAPEDNDTEGTSSVAADMAYYLGYRRYLSGISQKQKERKCVS